jgi:hypothetical protein
MGRHPPRQATMFSSGQEVERIPVVARLRQTGGHSALSDRSGRQAPKCWLVRCADRHPDLGAERIRPGDLGIWAPLIDRQQVQTGERGTQIFGPSAHVVRARPLIRVATEHDNTT